ncbi:MAG TPA: hypothetical protein VFM29_08135, partial [Vicinamibacteria bacterium]|nr:hypothetical protein [Vicinamibacteria bacterium]
MRALILTLAAAVAGAPALAADKKVEDALAKAESHLAKGNTDEAVKAVQKVANQGLEGQVALATIQARAGQVDEATASFAKAAGMAGTATGAVKAEALAAVATFELAFGSGASALKNAEAAVQAEPTPAALAAHARALARAGQAGAALQAADRAVQAGASSAIAHVSRGEALLASEKAAEAEA